MQNRKHRLYEIEDAAQLRQRIQAGGSLKGWTVQGVDLAGIGGLKRSDLEGCVFIGCRFEGPEQAEMLGKRGALVFPHFKGLPYNPYRTELYTVQELMEGYDEGGYTGTADFAIYAHSHRARYHPGGATIVETLAQRIHDHAVDDALAEFLEGRQNRGAIGIMGGHGTRRSDPFFLQVARLAWKLCRNGFLVISGGGPGTMEAANMGAWFANSDDPAVLEAAVDLLGRADTFDGGFSEGEAGFTQAVSEYIRAARQVKEEFAPSKGAPGVSLAVPTWFYGHEPSNLFATAIAKYFDNSIREEGLLAIATAGVVYAPGSAGTMQEIFQDLTQNHYATYGCRSPMVLFGSERYSEEHELIKGFVNARDMTEAYGDMIALLDDVDQIVEFIATHPPREVPRPAPLYDLARSAD